MTSVSGPTVALAVNSSGTVAACAGTKLQARAAVKLSARLLVRSHPRRDTESKCGLLGLHEGGITGAKERTFAHTFGAVWKVELDEDSVMYKGQFLIMDTYQIRGMAYFRRGARSARAHFRNKTDKDFTLFSVG